MFDLQQVIYTTRTGVSSSIWKKKSVYNFTVIFEAVTPSNFRPFDGLIQFISFHIIFCRSFVDDFRQNHIIIIIITSIVSAHRKDRAKLISALAPLKRKGVRSEENEFIQMLSFMSRLVIHRIVRVSIFNSKSSTIVLHALTRRSLKMFHRSIYFFSLQFLLYLFFHTQQQQKIFFFGSPALVCNHRRRKQR